MTGSEIERAALPRPGHLPDFRKPPLNEVVLGVQFKHVPGYQQIRAGEVWALFKENFPHVQELPALPPSFETFGPGGSIGQINFELIAGATDNRFWFLSDRKDELIQFQQDRLLHNWRKVGDQTNEYPRFEHMIRKFNDELEHLQSFFATSFGHQLTFTQCEISYINHILDDDQTNSIVASHWLNFLKFENADPEDFSTSFRHTILAPDGRRLGRMIVEASTARNAQKRQMIVFTLTARGAPSASDLPATLGFLKSGRELIVSEFASLTTDSAHRAWERVQ